MKMIFTESSTWDSEFKVGGHNYVRLFLQEEWNVFWFSYPFSLLHWLDLSSWKDNRSKFSTWLKGVQKQGQLNTYVPLTLLPYKDYPVIRSSWAGKNTLKFTIPRVDHLLKKHGFSQVDLICINNPVMLPLLEQIEYKKSVMRITDDMASFAGNPDSILELESEAIQKVDVVFTTSSHLLEKIKQIRDDIYYLPNGVEYNLFADFSGSPPKDYERISSPKIIYVGAIDDWFDVSMLKELAENLNIFSFLLIGAVKTDIDALKGLTNVHFLGPRSHEQIPGYLYYADVAIVPFKQSRLVDSVSPIKMYEFLAAGLPVVSTRWKELERVNPPIHLADTASQFIQAVKQAFETRNQGINERKEFAKENSWEIRFAYFKKIVGI